QFYRGSASHVRRSSRSDPTCSHAQTRNFMALGFSRCGGPAADLEPAWQDSSGRGKTVWFELPIRAAGDSLG
ncbi:hypothetical protein, partial [Streptomyces hygroscopicus]|uniref:hypothetical protein n=1 Tax=Streptomyces hygroscopicus TaxID=1912 RepID=UPI001BDD36FA